jgi:hypothetical protein
MERGKIQVPSQEVLDGILAVRDTGLTNMFNIGMVIKIAKTLGYNNTTTWIQDNMREYVKGVIQGYEVAK